jgi:hypothetical protein
MTMRVRPGIPRDNTELYRDFAPFVANEIRKLNTVVTNFEDACQDVWEKLLQAQVIEKFHERVSCSVPETMTALEACAFLGGIRFTQWRSRQWSYRKGHKQGKKKDGARVICKWMPDPITGGYASPKATYRGEDIVELSTRNDEMKWKDQGEITISAPKATPYQFLNYLGTSVRHHFANFCRTRSRKWKDRTGDSMPGKNLLGDNVPQFHTAAGGYNNYWEDTIRDDVAETRIEAQVALSRALDKLSSKGVDESAQKEIFTLLTDGYTLTEAINKSSLTPAKKRICIRAFL